ncbi:ABC transporter substrate-binding protein [Candidatus Bipolaricaulota bacterium]
MHRNASLIAVAAVLFLGLACIADDTFPVTVADDRNTPITIESAPQRIVVVAALYAEIIIGLDAADRLIAAAESPDNPTEATDLPSVGPTYAPNVELIVGFEPDLVLGATDWGGERPALEAAGITVLTTPLLTSVSSILDSIRTVARAIGETERGALLVGRIAAEIVQAEEAALGLPQVSVAFLYATSQDDPPYTAGSGAIENELILRAGGRNVFGDVEGFPQIGFEDILTRNPDVIFTAPSQIAYIVDNPLLQSVSAVANGRVIGIRASVVASTQVAEALRVMIEALHGARP